MHSKRLPERMAQKLRPLNPQVIGLQGIRGSGKDTFFQVLQDATPVVRLAFADLLYQEVAQAFGCAPEDLQVRETKELAHPRWACDQCSNAEFVETFLRLNPTVTLHTPQSPRKILQYWGSEFRRDRYSPSYWTDPVINTIRNNPSTRFVVTDTRFPNEAGLIAGVPPSMHYKFPLETTLSDAVLHGLPGGFLARIIRPDLLAQYMSLPLAQQHSSETSLLNWPVLPELTFVNPKGQVEQFRHSILRFARMLNEHPLD